MRKCYRDTVHRRHHTATPVETVVQFLQDLRIWLNDPLLNSMPTYTGHPDNIVAHLLATFHVPKSRDTICIFPECGDGVTELAVARALISNDIRVTRVWLMDMRIPTLRPTQPPAFQVHIFQSYAELCHALQVAVVGATHVPTVLIPGVHQQQIPTDAHDARHLTQFMHVSLVEMGALRSINRSIVN